MSAYPLITTYLQAIYLMFYCWERLLSQMPFPNVPLVPERDEQLRPLVFHDKLWPRSLDKEALRADNPELDSLHLIHHNRVPVALVCPPEIRKDFYLSHRFHQTFALHKAFFKFLLALLPYEVGLRNLFSAKTDQLL